MHHSPANPPKRNILTIGLDDYYHAQALKGAINRTHWYRFESRLDRNTQRALDLLDELDTKATFFVMGWVGERCPEIIRNVIKRGHEIASQGYCHRSVREMTPSEFREDIIRSRDALQQASGAQIVGNRCARPLIAPRDLWALDAVAEEGYRYDSSILPLFRSFHKQPWRRFAHRHSSERADFWEFPFSTWNCLGWMLPIAGGIYFRQIPHRVLKRKVEYWHQTYDAPFVMYFHIWELDADQPRISSASWLARIRHYRNLGKTSWVVKDYLRQYQFGSVANYLGICQAPCEAAIPATRPDRGQVVASATSDPSANHRTPVSIVVPFFNEGAILPYFFNTLEELETELSKVYELSFVLVDDHSSDETWDLLNARFGERADCVLVRQPENTGVAGAILTGIRQAHTEIVCSMDSDCTYDPHQLKWLIPALTDGVDLVTASPYHPQGEVLNVPAWRLFLSKSASFLYRCVVRQKLHTFTSCFRVYRRSAVAGIVLKEQGFLGVAEMIGKLDLSGSTIHECPATLEARVLGRSKMKTVRTIFGHLRVLSRLIHFRVFANRYQENSALDIKMDPEPVGPTDGNELAQRPSHTGVR